MHTIYQVIYDTVNA